MSCLGEKQPALSNEAEGRAPGREARRDHPGDPAEQKRKQSQEGGQDEAGKPDDTTKADTMFTRNRETHFLQQEIFFGVRALEDTHIASAAQRRRTCYRAWR